MYFQNMSTDCWPINCHVDFFHILVVLSKKLILVCVDVGRCLVVTMDAVSGVYWCSSEFIRCPVEQVVHQLVINPSSLASYTLGFLSWCHTVASLVVAHREAGDCH